MRTVSFVVALALVTTFCGCGGPGNVGTVTGTVTLDGQPLPDALVTFTPTGEGSPSAGRTDSNGVYKLMYTREAEGAELGDHTVRITTYSQGNPDGDPPVAATPEKVPSKYNVKTELKVTVTKGSNTHDFPLDGQGEIADHQKLERAETRRRQDSC